MTERKCTCNKHFSIKVRGPNIEAGGKSAYNNVQVGVGPNIENFEMKFYRQCELGCGPQHSEIGSSQFLQAMQVGVGPQHREFRNEILQAMEVGVRRRNKFCENIISVPPHSK
ncbi:hypothetical protein FVP18_03215 [Staphylococcus aureus]|nr:hypothetical protein FFY14_05970 [Staphylococcus aureus]TLV73843.1 hypothetical protein FFY18_01725 [Staphylococcus aureus]TXO39465.1 hypothetical protein FVP18_03215 [Staphylococcus aureus]